MDPLSALENHIGLWPQYYALADMVGGHDRLFLCCLLMLSVRFFRSGSFKMAGNLVFQSDKIYDLRTSHPAP